MPEGAVSLALIVDDPDAPVGTFTHWLAWGIDPAGGGLAEGERAPREGRNGFGQTGYRGPCPPRRHGPHRYFFRLYALARERVVRPGASRRDLADVLAGRCDTSFFEFFAEPAPGFEQQALAVADQGLAAGDSPERARCAAPLLHAYELMFWDTLADAL